MTGNSNDDGQFDVFADQFTITITPFGANLSFHVREPHPSTGRAPKVQDLGTVRMSVEHLKTMVMIIRRQAVIKCSAAGAQPVDQSIIYEQIKYAIHRYPVNRKAAFQGFKYITGR